MILHSRSLPSLIYSLLLIFTLTPRNALASTMGSDITVSRFTPEEFFQRLHLFDEAEIKAGSLAQKVGKTSAVRDFGKIMVDDNHRLEEKLAKAAANEKVSFRSSEYGPKAQAQLQKLNAVQKQLERVDPVAFDQTFLNAMIDSHKDALSLVSEVKDAGKNEHMQSIAEDALPVLKKHIDLAKNTLEQLGYASHR